MAEGYGMPENETQRDLEPFPIFVRQYSSDEESECGSEYRGPADSAVDFSYLNLDGLTMHENIATFTSSASNGEEFVTNIKSLYLQHNRLDFIPQNIGKFRDLRHLDLSNNSLTEISEAIFTLRQLKLFSARNNFLGDYSLPKKLHMLESLEELNLSGNLFKSMPPEIVELHSLKSLYLGGNEIEELPREIWKLSKLENLYLGGNNLKDIPAEMGRLHSLRSLVLCENQLQSLPSTISCLRRLRSLLLHKNKLTTLPPEIVTLKGLVELSLRDNPLVVRFVQEMTYDPPSLRELSARCIKLFRVPYSEKEIPSNLASYLQSACRCVNPKCRGVYFDARVEHIKFVDFCGKYRLPLLQYLCSPKCSLQPLVSGSMSDASASSDDDGYVPSSRIRRVLLG